MSRKQAKATDKPKLPALSPKLRQALCAWPVGHTIKSDGYDITLPGGDKVWTSRLNNALARGLLTMHPDPKEVALGHTVGYKASFTRTDAPLAPYKPVGSKPMVANARWPWRVPEHWRHLEGSPFRAPRNVAERLALANVAEKDWQTKRVVQYPGDPFDYRFPELVTSKTDLGNLREWLERVFFGGGRPVVKGYNKGFRERLAREKPHWTDSKYLLLQLTPESLRALCCYLLVEPVFEGDRVVRFAARSVDDAVREFKQLTTDTADLTAKYRAYFAHRACLTQSRQPPEDSTIP